jgi:peptidyl-prolyl cis-trans isomerase SurA
MTLNKYFLIFFFILIFFNIKTNAVENKILFKVDNDIITSIDIYKESLYLELINPNLKELSMEKIYEISKNSLIREKIKEIELRKNFKAVDVNKEYLSQLMINYSSKMGFSNENELKNYFKLRNLNIDDLKKKIRQEVLWNQLIVRKFLKDVKIDENKIKNNLKINNKQTEYFLSEILFNIENKNDLNEKINLIKKDIKIKGFASAALIHGISDSSKNGGELGWIKKSSLNKIIQNKISKIKIDNITDPIVVPGGFLILKIKDKRLIDKKINIADEVKLIVEAKTNEQLNRFSITYFNKIKKNIQINEF